MIGVDINCQLMERQLRIDKSWSRLRYKAAMQTKDKIQRTAATEIGARILEVIGDDSYEAAAARVQQRGGKVSAPAMHKWVQGTGEITEPNIRAFCEAYGVSPA